MHRNQTDEPARAQVFHRGGADAEADAEAAKKVNLTRERYMLLYTAVHNFCTQTGKSHAVNSRSSTGGASLVGRELYDKVIEFLKEHCNVLLEEGMVASKLSLDPCHLAFV